MYYIVNKVFLKYPCHEKLWYVSCNIILNMEGYLWNRKDTPGRGGRKSKFFTEL